ncbi:MAG: hypothetical protein WAM42_02980, partial [Candidatus Nitrosopolaris sp.]
FFSILPIAVALIVMVNRLIYGSSEEQESKSKLDFDYCCVLCVYKFLLENNAKEIHMVSGLSIFD